MNDSATLKLGAFFAAGIGFIVLVLGLSAYLFF